MVDIAALGVALLTVLAVMIRQTSAGVGILALLAGVMLDQLLTNWLVGLLPKSDAISQDYIIVAIRLLLTFIPVVVTIIAVRVKKHNKILSLLASLMLGFLITFFGLKIVSILPSVTESAKNSGLLHFLDPYQNTILAGSTILALVEMILSHTSKEHKKKKI